MGKKTERYWKDSMSGIKVHVKKFDKGYKVKVTVPPNQFFVCQSITVQSKYFSIKVNLKVPAFKLEDAFSIKVEGTYNMTKCGLIKNKQAVLKFDTDICNGTLILNPKFYIDSQRRATEENLRNSVKN